MFLLTLLVVMLLGAAVLGATTRDDTEADCERPGFSGPASSARGRWGHCFTLPRTLLVADLVSALRVTSSISPRAIIIDIRGFHGSMEQHKAAIGLLCHEIVIQQGPSMAQRSPPPGTRPSSGGSGLSCRYVNPQRSTSTRGMLLPQV